MIPGDILATLPDDLSRRYRDAHASLLDAIESVVEHLAKAAKAKTYRQHQEAMRAKYPDLYARLERDPDRT